MPSSSEVVKASVEILNDFVIHTEILRDLDGKVSPIFRISLEVQDSLT